MNYSQSSADPLVLIVLVKYVLFCLGYSVCFSKDYRID